MRVIFVLVIVSAIKSDNTQPANLAFQRPTYQTQPYKEKVSDMAVDGNINTCAHLVVNDSTKMASWNVQLDETYDIKTVIIYYDLGLPYLRHLNDIVIYVSSDATNYENCAYFKIINASQRVNFLTRGPFLNLSCSENIFGNMVHIVKSDVTDLNNLVLCEVYVYGKVNHDTITLSYRRPTDQSGVLFRNLSSLAVDGKLETCTRVRASKHDKAWWRVTLNNIHAISGISIHFYPNDRKVGFLNNFKIYVSNDIDNFEQQLCFFLEGNVTTSDSYINLTCSHHVVGMYVTIKKSGGYMPERLYFCEVFIYPKRIDQNCTDGSMPCKSDCIPKAKICDRVKDCYDGRDELSCACLSYQFKCDNGLCIPFELTCDGTKDCPNGDDEQIPLQCSCPKNEFKCLKFSQCIPKSQVCDGLIHCNDSSDELRCLKFENESLTSSLVKASFHGEDDFYICSTHWNNLISFRVCEYLGRSLAVTSNYVWFQTLKILKFVPDQTVVNKATSIMFSFQKSNYCESGHFISLECSQFPDCGISGTDETYLPYIINGDVAKPDAWPWHFQLVKNGYTSCGGSIINNNWILTAAHCVEKITNISQILITVGTKRMKNNPMAISYPVARLVIHPEFSNVSRDDDIAMIQTRTRIASTPICLPSEYYDEKKLMSYRYCFITGFGHISRDATLSYQLRQGRLNIMSKEQCLRNLLNVTKLRNASINVVLNSKKKLCSGSVPTTYGVNLCKGDSGGPFACKDEHGIWTQIGIVESFYKSKQKLGCTNNNIVRVDFYLEFIRNIIHTYQAVT